MVDSAAAEGGVKEGFLIDITSVMLRLCTSTSLNPSCSLVVRIEVEGVAKDCSKKDVEEDAKVGLFNLVSGGVWRSGAAFSFRVRTILLRSVVSSQERALRTTMSGFMT